MQQMNDNERAVQQRNEKIREHAERVTAARIRERFVALLERDLRNEFGTTSYGEYVAGTAEEIARFIQQWLAGKIKDEQRDSTMRV